MKTIIEVKIDSIEVDDFYFSFNYSVKVNEKLKKASRYESNHSQQDDKEGFWEILKNGQTVKLALEETF